MWQAIMSAKKMTCYSVCLKFVVMDGSSDGEVMMMIMMMKEMEKGENCCVIRV